MHHGSGALLGSPFVVIGLSGYLGEGLHHLLLIISILFAVIVLVSGILRRSLQLRRRG
jgi:hypothetical protein